MMTVKLELEDWQRVLAILAQQPWGAVNPLIMSIGDQLRMQSPAAQAGGLHNDGMVNQAGPPNGADRNP